MADTDLPSSRIFIKGLPPTFTDAEFRKHFSKNRELTDAKIFPNRRIGYVGYRTPEDAQSAVKYFNKSFIRMSRIGVELARPVPDVKIGKTRSAAPTARLGGADGGDASREEKLKRKRDEEEKMADDPKLKEFLEAYKPKSKKKETWGLEEGEALTLDAAAPDGETPVVSAEGQSDNEYEHVPKRAKKAKPEQTQTPAVKAVEAEAEKTADGNQLEVDLADEAQPRDQDPNAADQPAMSDLDWARSRTSRLLGLLDDEEEENAAAKRPAREDASVSEEEGPVKALQISGNLSKGNVTSSMPTPPLDEHESAAQTTADGDGSAMRSGRLFLRNLPYDVKQEDLQADFEQFGPIEEVHVPLDTKTGAAKGFAYVEFSEPDAAERALNERDGQIFQGRLLHILPATAKRETKLDDFALSKLPLKKQQQIKRKREASSTAFNWNALYMNADAVVSSVADRLGLAKSEVLDPTSSDAAVKQAHAETHIIQETKAYFKQQGVDLDAFKRSQRGDMAILVKNIPYDCSQDELKRLFEEHGVIARFIMPPSGVIAIVQFANAAQCKTAFGALAYKKVKSSILFLEKAPKDLFTTIPASASEAAGAADGITKQSASDLKDAADATVPDTAGTATLFVRNLNFTTTTPQLTETFKPLSGFLSARVKTRTEPKRPGQVLSMGFGFLEFRDAAQAQAALKAMDGYTLDGHKLQVRASHKGADAAEERRKADTAKKVAGRKTKVIIKNLPFEATKKDVRALFGAYGQLRSVRVPKKMDHAARGFAFADFVTPKEAENAMDALKDTHLLGRRLVLDFAAGDAVDAEEEIERMQKKVGGQVNKVALAKLVGGGRKKFSTGDEEGAE